MASEPMTTRFNPSENKTYLVEINDKTLKKLGLSDTQIQQLKINKIKREKEALAIIQQSGVPRERWPKFKPDIYYIEKDFTGDLQPFAAEAFIQGEPMVGTGHYVYPNADNTRTEYPFSVGTFLPTTNTSPLQKVVEILTAEDGTVLITEQNYKDLKDMVSYVLSSQNYNKHVFNLQSLRAPYKDGKYYSTADIKANPSLNQHFTTLSTFQANTVEAYLLKFDTNLKSDHMFINMEGALMPRSKNSAGVALSRDGGSASTYNKYNNVVLVSLTLSVTATNRDDLVDYDYYSEKLGEDVPGQYDSGKDNYEKFYKNTQATTVMPVSGVNIQVVFEFPSNSSHKSVYLYMPDMITISHSVHRTKVPVTVLGDTTITGIGLGTKMVAGSIVKVFTRRDSFHNYVRLFVDERSATMSKERKASLINVQNTVSMNEMSDHMRDDIGPFNIHLIMMSEYDCVHQDPPKVDSILGCTIINTGKVYSIENLITEETLSFMAKTVVYDDDMSASVVRSSVGNTVETGSSLLAQLRGI